MCGIYLGRKSLFGMINCQTLAAAVIPTCSITSNPGAECTYAPSLPCSSNAPRGDMTNHFIWRWNLWNLGHNDDRKAKDRAHSRHFQAMLSKLRPFAAKSLQFQLGETISNPKKDRPIFDLPHSQPHSFPRLLAFLPRSSVDEICTPHLCVYLPLLLSIFSPQL